MSGFMQDAFGQLEPRLEPPSEGVSSCHGLSYSFSTPVVHSSDIFRLWRGRGDEDDQIAAVVVFWSR